MLLIKFGSEISPMNLQQQSPLHLAAMYGAKCLFDVLVAAAANPMETDGTGKTAIELAEICGWNPTSTQPTSTSRSNKSDKKDPVSNKTPLSNSIATSSTSTTTSSTTSTTAIITHPLCLEHHTCPPSVINTTPMRAPPENLHRLRVLIDEKNGVLQSQPMKPLLQWYNTSSKATLSDVLRVHEWSYVRMLQAKCTALRSANTEDEEDEDVELDSLD
eukprot:gene54023-72199_t